MLYSLPSRDIIADSVEYMVNAHKADAMVCISNCDSSKHAGTTSASRTSILFDIRYFLIAYAFIGRFNKRYEIL